MRPPAVASPTSFGFQFWPARTQNSLPTQSVFLQVLHAVDGDGRVHRFGHQDGAVLVRKPLECAVVVVGDALGDRAAQVEQEPFGR